MKKLVTALVLSLIATSATAQETLTQRAEFLKAVTGQILEIRLLRVQLAVLDTGTITGKAFGRGVTGTWEWKDGFFCRWRQLWGWTVNLG